MKQEWASLGGDPSEEAPNPMPIDAQEDSIECAGLVLNDATHRDATVKVTRSGNDMQFTDPSTGTKKLSELAAGGGMTESAHEALDTLTHELAETCWTEVVRTGGLVTSIVTWETSGKLKKVRETLITRTTGQVSQVVTKHYDAAGTLKVTLTKDISRTGGQVTSISTTRA